MKEYLLFKKMIAPVAIQVIFWLSSLLFVILGIYVMTRKEVVSSYDYFGGDYGGLHEQSSPGFIFLGLFLIVGGILYSRIMSEFLIVVFRIYDTLRDIRGGGDGTFSPGNIGSPAPAAGLQPQAGLFTPTAGLSSPVVTHADANAINTDAGTSCSACGGQNDPGQQFCTSCGAQLT